MSYFYHDDEEDYYHGGTGLQGLKTTFESGKEKFTLDDESDDDDSPQFAGSFQAKRAWGGAPATTKAPTKAPATRPKVPKPKPKTKPIQNSEKLLEEFQEIRMVDHCLDILKYKTMNINNDDFI